MSIRTYAALAGLVSSLVLPLSVSADPLYQDFGALDEATFGGAGIPNEEVAISTFVNGSTSITVAMSATQRFSNAEVTNDGNGTYFARPGSNFGGDGESGNEGALWNFNYYITIDSTTETLLNYQIDIFYDFDPALDNETGLGSINLTNALAGLGLGPNTPTTVEDSQNLLFGFLATTDSFVITAPTGPFDANALGEYNFGIRVSQALSSFEENLKIDVQVVPIPAAAWLFGSALLGLSVVKRRKS